MKKEDLHKGMKFCYVSERGYGMSHNKIFTVQSVGTVSTVLCPVQMSLTNPSFRINTADFLEAIEIGIYKIEN